jgi:hypothetical protein
MAGRPEVSATHAPRGPAFLKKALDLTYAIGNNCYCRDRFVLEIMQLRTVVTDPNLYQSQYLVVAQQCYPVLKQWQNPMKAAQSISSPFHILSLRRSVLGVRLKATFGKFV